MQQKRNTQFFFTDVKEEKICFNFYVTFLTHTWKCFGAPCTVCNVLHGSPTETGRKNEQQNNAPSPKNNAAASYQGPVKIKLLKGAGPLSVSCCFKLRQTALQRFNLNGRSTWDFLHSCINGHDFLKRMVISKS